jgi:hypothetical protein
MARMLFRILNECMHLIMYWVSATKMRMFISGVFKRYKFEILGCGSLCKGT